MRGGCSNIWHLDELCLMINGKRGWLWRAVDDAGEVLDILVQPSERPSGEAVLSQTLEGPRDGTVLLFVRDVAERNGIDPTTAAGRQQLRRHLTS